MQSPSMIKVLLLALLLLPGGIVLAEGNNGPGGEIPPGSPIQDSTEAAKGSLSGLILNAANGLRLPGVRIEILADRQGQHQQNVINRESPSGFDGRISDELGEFQFRALKAGTYTLLLSCLGYQGDTLQIQIDQGQVRKLEIRLEEDALKLSAVQITSAPGEPFSIVQGLDLKLRPVASGQDLLRTVPGLVISQHAGGGKAEQIFLRGFDLDHGTDIQLTVDGTPVNMVSHAHGQGYSDLHFLIPELVEALNYGKGPYYADKGNFATAGYVDFKTRDFLDGNTVKVEAGAFQTFRGLTMLDLGGKKLRERGHSVYAAGEYLFSNGFFDRPQGLQRVNLFGKYQGRISGKHLLTASASFFQSGWDQMGQIPERAVETGLISRYGTLDTMQGGTTGRSQVNLQLRSVSKSGAVFRNQVYFVGYDFDLFSNFTLFLNDSLNGDQIRQSEQRQILGYQASVVQEGRLLGMRARYEGGLGVRADRVKGLGLWQSQNRNVLAGIQAGAVREINSSAYADLSLSPTDRISINLGLRGDHFSFGYRDDLAGGNQQESYIGWTEGVQHASRMIVSPKLNLSYKAAPGLKLFVQSGTGFHSNDSRVVLTETGTDILPRSYGAETGMIWKGWDRLLLNVSLWSLWQDQEFVYVGDEGIVEAGGRSRRLGTDVSIRLQLTDWLLADFDYNFALPRSLDAGESGAYIPLAPLHSSIGGLTLNKLKGFSGALRYRWLADRPLNEDFSLAAEGFFLMDALLNYTWKNWTIGSSLLNILNSQWKEAQFEVESRLQTETNPVTERHFTPGAPRSWNLSLQYTF